MWMILLYFGVVNGDGPGRGIPAEGDWVSFYGKVRDPAQVAAHFRVINIDADPDADNVTDEQIRELRAGGKNRVISYLDVGSCEKHRSYYQVDPPGHLSCLHSGALTTAYVGYPDERWANLANPAYRDLIVNHVAARLAARGVDGFFLDNLEVVEHGARAKDGPCDAACAQGGLDLVWELRQRFPHHLIVMQNANGDVTRLGQTHGVALASLLDGVSGEEPYAAGADPAIRADLIRWRDLHLSSGGQPFWLGVEDYVGSCTPKLARAAAALRAKAEADGFHAYVTDSSGKQLKPCVW
jgi:cysteinyl-tRNA synthetase